MQLINVPQSTIGTATAKVICDSIYRKSRLTTVEVEFPRSYLAEINTHRWFSRNSASSRAIPVWKRLTHVLSRPYVPSSFGTNKPGMQAGNILSNDDQEAVIINWLIGRDAAVLQAYCLAGGRKQILEDSKNNIDAIALCDRIDLLALEYPDIVKKSRNQNQGLHKQHANRLIEAYSYHTVVITSSYWRNFFGLRASENAQPEAQDLGIAIAMALMGSTPTELQKGQWHLPYISEEDRLDEQNMLVLARASSGKCARTSYLTHDGLRSLIKDVSGRCLADEGTCVTVRAPSTSQGKWGSIEFKW